MASALNEEQASNASQEASGGHRPHSHDHRSDILLSTLMHDVGRMRRAVFDQRMRPLGITRSHAWVLARLGLDDGMSQTRLAQILNVGKAALGTFLERLEATGLVYRSPDAVDKRLKRVYLSKEGARVVRQMQKLSRPMNEEILTGLSGEERQQLTSYLAIVRANLLSLLEQDPSLDED